jgi:hypothetical protein
VLAGRPCRAQRATLATRGGRRRPPCRSAHQHGECLSHALRARLIAPEHSDELEALRALRPEDFDQQHHVSSAEVTARTTASGAAETVETFAKQSPPTRHRSARLVEATGAVQTAHRVRHRKRLDWGEKVEVAASGGRGSRRRSRRIASSANLRQQRNRPTGVAPHPLRERDPACSWQSSSSAADAACRTRTSGAHGGRSAPTAAPNARRSSRSSRTTFARTRRSTDT